MINISLSLGQKQFLMGLARDRSGRFTVILTEEAIGIPALLGVHSLARHLTHPGFFHEIRLDDGKEILWSAPPDRTTSGQPKGTGRMGVFIPPVALINIVPFVGSAECLVTLTDMGRQLCAQIEEVLAYQAVSNIVKDPANS